MRLAQSCREHAYQSILIIKISHLTTPSACLKRRHTPAGHVKGSSSPTKYDTVYFHAERSTLRHLLPVARSSNYKSIASFLFLEVMILPLRYFDSLRLRRPFAHVLRSPPPRHQFRSPHSRQAKSRLRKRMTVQKGRDFDNFDEPFLKRRAARVGNRYKSPQNESMREYYWGEGNGRGSHEDRTWGIESNTNEVDRNKEEEGKKVDWE
jgi:hypothetical protein